MAKNCCDAADVGDVHNDPRWRKVLWVALGLNAIMFAVEIVAGIAADSRALQADALDFFYMIDLPPVLPSIHVGKHTRGHVNPRPIEVATQQRSHHLKGQAHQRRASRNCPFPVPAGPKDLPVDLAGLVQQRAFLGIASIDAKPAGPISKS